MRTYNTDGFLRTYQKTVNGGRALTTVESANLAQILTRASVDERVSLLAHLAYMIATARWETRRFEAMRELGSDNYLKQYQGKGGNVHPGDYKRFRGGGWCHLTFRDGYRRAGLKLRRGEPVIIVDLEANPEKILSPDINYEIMVRGHLEGWFTKWKLGDYINEGRVDYRAARRVINPGELFIADGQYKATAERREQCRAAVGAIVQWSKAIEAALRLNSEEEKSQPVEVIHAELDAGEYEPKPTPDAADALHAIDGVSTVVASDETVDEYATRVAAEESAALVLPLEAEPPGRAPEPLDVEPLRDKTPEESATLAATIPSGTTKEPEAAPKQSMIKGFVQASEGSFKRIQSLIAGLGVNIVTAGAAVIQFGKDNPVLVGVAILACMILATVLVIFYIYGSRKDDEQRRAIAANPHLINVK